MGILTRNIGNLFSKLVNPRFYGLLKIILIASIKGKNKPGRTRVLRSVLHYVDASSLIGMYNELIFQEIYSFRTTTSHPVIIDCGANIGVSVLFFKKQFPNAQLVAVEADPVIADVLRKNLALNGITAEIIQKAIWSKSNEKIQFGSSGDDSGSIYNTSNTHEVETISLQSLIDQFDEVELLKIDIEGAEIEAIKHGELNLANVKRAFVEFYSFPGHPQELESLLSVFAAQGFRYYILPARKMHQPFLDNHSSHSMDLQLNIFFVKND